VVQKGNVDKNAKSQLLDILAAARVKRKGMKKGGLNAALLLCPGLLRWL
jgi:hypothetical protein